MNAPSRVDWFAEVKLWPVADVANRLGLEVVRKGADVSFPCPACRKVLRHSRGADRRHAAKVMPENRWWCEPCGASGDAVALAAAVTTGSPTPPRKWWADVRARCASVGLCTDLSGRPPPPRPFVTFGPPAESTPLAHAPQKGVEALWRACGPVGLESEAGRYLAARGFDVARLPWLEVVRQAPEQVDPVEWWPAAWLRRWPLMFPAYDVRGELVSLHGRALANVEPKTRWPYRCSASGLMFADSMGVTFLRQCARGASVDGLEAVVVCEGATDTLKLSEVVDGAECAFAVLGYVAGSKRAFAGIDWPVHVPCVVATDNDAVGDKYAAELRGAIDWRVPMFRVRVPQARSPEGRKAGDWSDMSNPEVLEALTAQSRWEVCHG
jgi:hypothetical protein